jgi:hypothetical protein
VFHTAALDTRGCDGLRGSHAGPGVNNQLPCQGSRGEIAMGFFARLFGREMGARKCAICGVREGELRKTAYRDSRRVGWVSGSTCRRCGFICDNHRAKVIHLDNGVMCGGCPECGEPWGS